MATIEQITDSLHKKIQFVTGDEFYLEKDYRDQLKQIIDHMAIAVETSKNDENASRFMRFLINKKLVGKNNEFEKANELFAKYYTRTNSDLEKRFWNNYSPLNFRCISELEENGWENHKTKYEYYHKIIQTAERYLLTEELLKVKLYFINIICSHAFYTSPWAVRNNENSGTGLHSDRNSPRVTKFGVRIYLVSDNRIIKLEMDDNSLLTSVEHILQKDLKKIEIINDLVVCFHYHGLHDPDELVLDSYEEAVTLRKEISRLREMRVNSRG